MKKNFFALSALFTTLFFVSCQKSSDSPSTIANIKGTWTFISMDGITNSTVEATQDGETDKSITLSNFTTENNSGTITIDDATIKTNNIAYSINTTAKAYMYQNNVLVDSVEAPFNFVVPPSSATASYRFVSGDSIYFDQGAVLTAGVTQNTVSGGARIKLDGDMLYITQSVNQVAEQTASGVTVATDEMATEIIKLKRQ